MRIRYKDAGVDLAKMRRAHETIEGLISATHRFNRSIISGYGHYAGLIEMDGDVLAIHTDGVGTKVLVAQMAGRFDTVGIDCVAMNVNDIICVGAKPTAFVDYIAVRKANERLVRQITKGLVKGAKEAGVAIVGGETAVMPDVISGYNDETAFDLAGTVIGIAKKKELIMGDKIAAGDVIVGVESNGLHSNGYSLARKVLLRRYRIDERVKELGHELGAEMLRPTRIYVRPVLEVLKNIKVHGLAHITGGAFTKLTRLNKKFGFEFESMPEPPAVFRLIQRHAGISEKEMYRTFNMGVGFCLIVPRGAEDKVMRVFRRHKMRSSVVGRVGARSGIYIGRLRLC